jgi:hypothetical protein
MTHFPSPVLHDWRIDSRLPRPTARAKAAQLRSKGARR